MRNTHAFIAASAVFFLTALPCAAQQALLWIPAGQQGAGDIISELETGKDLRLTAAFDELPKGLEERIKKLQKDGRLELALRPAGDPPLPLLYYPAAPEVRWQGKASTAAFTSDRYFLAARLGMAKEAAFKALKLNPEGFVSPPGGLAADYFPLAKALGLKWLATGPIASTAAAVFEADGVCAVPFVRFSTSAANAPFVVFDETAETDPARLRSALAAELKASSPQKRLTVSEALKLAVSTRAVPEELSALASPWSGDYTAWASTPSQAGALAAFAKTRSDLMLYLNASQGDYKAAKPAFSEYFSAEDGGKLLTLASGDPDAASEAEIEIRNTLGNAYRMMQQAPPSWVFSSLADAAAAPEEAEKLRIKTSTSGFEISNVSRKPEIPAQTGLLSRTADPYKVWKLSSFKVEADTDTLTFSFSPLELDNPRRLPSGFAHIRIDLYIDINHRPRAGSSRLLDGRPFRMFPEDAWEYALEITPANAVLYTATQKGPAAAGTFKPRAENGAVILSVPRATMIGNPLLWGYAALMLAPKGDNTFTVTDYIASDVSNGYIYAVRVR